MAKSNNLQPNATQEQIDAYWKAVADSVCNFIPKIYSPNSISDSVNKEQKSAIFGKWNGKSCKIISKNYQTGRATIEAHDVTGPYNIEVSVAELDIENPKAGNCCTCGHDSLRPGLQSGKHDHYCDKYFNIWD